MGRKGAEMTLVAIGRKYVTQWGSEPGMMCFAHYVVVGSTAAFVLVFFTITTIWWSVIFPIHVALTMLHLVVGLGIDIKLEGEGKWH